MDVDDGVLAPRVVQDALGRRRLAGVDVGDDPDIADIGKRSSAGHGRFRAVLGDAVNSKPGPGAPGSDRLAAETGSGHGSVGADSARNSGQSADSGRVFHQPGDRATSRMQGCVGFKSAPSRPSCPAQSAPA